MPEAGPRPLSGRETVLSLLAAVLGVAYFLLWELAHRGIFAYATAIYPLDDADEWRYTGCSVLVQHGYAMFQQVFSAQPPMLFLSLAVSMRVFGDTITGARGAEIVFGLLGIAAAAWIAHTLAGPAAAGATVLLLAVSAPYLAFAHMVEAEGPMMALMTLSLALSLAATRHDRRFLPALAGLVLAAAVLVKLFALEALAPGLWILAAAIPNRRRAISAGLLYLLGVAVPVAADFLFVYPAQQWDQVVRLHQKVAGIPLPGLLPPARIMREFLGFDLGLSLLALAGLLALLLGRRWQALGFLGLWIGGTALMLLIFRPLFPHHPAILLTGLGVAGGVAAGWSLEMVTRREWRLAAPSLLAILAYLVLVPRLAHDDRHLLVAGQPGTTAAVTAYLDARSLPGDFVATDDLAAADQAHRLVPPPLCDPSTVRLRAGYLTASDLIESTVRYDASLVVAGDTYHQVRGYMAWLSQKYKQVPAPPGFQAFLP